MEANELRIGNLIDYHKQSCHVMGVYSNNKVELGYFTDSAGFVRSLDDVGIKPIPLTEEILLNCGFKKSSEYWYAIKFKVYTEMGGTQINELSINPEIGKCNIEFVGYVDAPMKGDSGVLLSDYQTQYLHQLQNLYFSLTGEELIYTP